MRKDPLLPHPLHSPVWGRGQGLLPMEPLRFALENMSYTSIIIRNTWKITFLLKTSETKKCIKIFFKAFLIFKQISCLRHP
jgi:hypothetical protein